MLSNMADIMSGVRYGLMKGILRFREVFACGQQGSSRSFSLQPRSYYPADEDWKESVNLDVFPEFFQDLPIRLVDIFSGNPELLYESVNGADMFGIFVFFRTKADTVENVLRHMLLLFRDTGKESIITKHFL